MCVCVSLCVYYVCLCHLFPCVSESVIVSMCVCVSLHVSVYIHVCIFTCMFSVPPGMSVYASVSLCVSGKGCSGSPPLTMKTSVRGGLRSSLKTPIQTSHPESPDSVYRDPSQPFLDERKQPLVMAEERRRVPRVEPAHLLFSSPSLHIILPDTFTTCQ